MKQSHGEIGDHPLLFGEAAADAEMEVIVMGRVVIRPQHNAEEAAGFIAQVTQERRLRRFAFRILLPVPSHIDAAAIPQRQRRKIECIGGGMLAAARAAANIAAGIGSQMRYAVDLLAEMLTRQRLQAVVLKHRVRNRQRTARHK